ncbi:FT-interacting protein 1 [Brachypodium distachyon]|nr:FT-interacting protein 1 [Brachypodium distachyon]|eukprot:XP_003579504.1 FT-interacting protein 1 [Brachypodium distachyon]
MRYDRLRSVAGRVQTVVRDLAMQGESLLSWRDPRATSTLIVAIVLYVTLFQVVAVIAGLYLLRHPKFRGKQPSVPFNLYKRLPARGDMLIYSLVYTLVSHSELRLGLGQRCSQHSEAA